MLFHQWQEVLPKHRPLKEFDRVCENHFQEEDILRAWEHTINGKKERMERKKPALKSKAVPCYIDVNVMHPSSERDCTGTADNKRIKRKKGLPNPDLKVMPYGYMKC